ncbi:VanZ family protein [Pseudoclavibacter sp. CFCC 13796]|uniref:VanZ family protein n=1 Tax=Pseudoclavibacter sp. CFCC 13796 TaxID=2615179 RepID=UPI001787BB96|nr:VanZ family protein [Pseudoclavibacter sp. CFCC 13796]
MPQNRAHPSPSEHRRLRLLAGCMFVVYMVIVGFIVMWPTPVDRDLSPELSRTLAWIHRRGAPEFIDYLFVERAANVLMFVPAGFFITLLMPRRLWWLAWAICVVGSCLIELSQLLLLPDRFASVDDIIMNSLGGFIGVAIAALVRRRMRVSHSTSDR